MKKRDVLARLRDLRQLRESRAGAEAAQRRQDVSASSDRIREACDAVALELQKSAGEEREVFETLSGNLVSTNSLHEMQHRFTTAAGRLQALEAAEGEARDLERGSREELAKARDMHRLQRLKLESLDSVIERKAIKGRRRHAAIEELADEEQSGALHTPRRPFRA